MSSMLWRVCEGQVVDGKYHLQKLLGAGSFGGVFLADEVVADRLIRQVAIKLIEPSPERTGRQLQELIAATNLDHPALLRCLTPGQCRINDLPFLYMVTELADGTLADRLAAGPLAVEEAREVAQRLAGALAYLAEQPRPLVHRDVKPANVMRTGGRWKLGDFGLLRTVDTPEGARTEALVGTAAYAPPESYEGIIAPAWDAWSLGVLLVEALTGCLPFIGETPQQLMIAVSSREPILPDGLPEPFHRIVRGCLIKDRRTRWTAAQVLESLSQSPVASASVPSSLGSAFYERMGVREEPETASAPETLTVSTGGRGHCRSIGEAIRSASPGARIRVLPGLYAEEIVLDREVEIVGDGDRAEIIVETTGAPCLTMATERASVRSLTLQSRLGLLQRRHAAVEIARGQLTLEDCDIVCNSLACVMVQDAAATPLLRRCRLHEGKTGGIVFTEGAGGTLEECEITENSGPGVALSSQSNPTLRNCHIHANRYGGVTVQEGGRGVLEECHLYANSGPGVHIADGGNPILRGCGIHSGTQAGIHFRQGGQGLVEECDIYANMLSGVMISQGANPTLRRCKIRDGYSNGVWVSENGQGAIEDCEIFGNAFAGLKVSQAGSPVVRRTSFHSGKRTGITIQDRGKATLADCAIYGNAQAGVQVESGGLLVARRSLIHDGKDSGLWFAGTGTVEECEIYNNAKAGIEITQGGEPLVRNCRIHHGQFPGILAHGGGLGLVEDCDIYENALPGIAIGEQSRLTVQRCKIRDGQQVGLVFWEGGRGVVEECDITGNVMGGVRIRLAADPFLRNCRINRNRSLGVYVSEQGVGALVRCDLRDNGGGPLRIETGCATECIENTL